MALGVPSWRQDKQNDVKMGLRTPGYVPVATQGEPTGDPNPKGGVRARNARTMAKGPAGGRGAVRNQFNAGTLTLCGNFTSLRDPTPGEMLVQEVKCRSGVQKSEGRK